MEQNTKKKIPCGGFDLDESVFNVDKNTKQLKLNSPISYDYMPEGYPTKSVGTVTLMEEQELAFTLSDGFYIAPATNVFEIVEGQTYTVSWDATEYECVGAAFRGGRYILGNPSIMDIGADTGEPFLYVYDRPAASGTFITLDTSASHTISVKRVEETVTPMAEEFLPNILDIDSIIMKSSTTDSTKKFRITVDDSGTLKATEV